ncbi:MAG: hypothetical protein ACRDMV_04105 [Streptosporangiales bacterium]
MPLGSATAGQWGRAAVRGTARDQDHIRRGQWAHRVTWGTQLGEVAAWRGLPTWTLPDVPDVLLIDLPGHSTAHAGIVLPTTGGWFLHAGDAYFYHAQLGGSGGVPPAVQAFTENTEQDKQARIRTQDLLTELARHPDITLICAHDPVELPSVPDR